MAIVALSQLSVLGELLLTGDNAAFILGASDLFRIDEVRELCAQFLMQLIDEDSALVILNIADQCGLEDLAAKARACVLRSFEALASRPEFLDLSSSALRSLFVSDDLCATSEQMVFEAADRWIRHDDSRSADLELILSAVRFEEIPAGYLLAHFTDPVLQALGHSSGENDCAEINARIARASHRPSPLHRTRGILSLLVLGGVLDGSAPGNALAYDFDTCSWSPVQSSLQTRRHAAVSVSAFGTIYLIGGLVETEKRLLPTSSVELYSHTERRWMNISPLPLPLTGARAVHLMGHVYVTGGSSHLQHSLSCVYRYEKHTDQFELRKCSSLMRSCFALDGRRWLICCILEDSMQFQLWMTAYSSSVAAVVMRC